MKKLVIKTTVMTLVIVLSAMIISVGALCLFAPKTVATFFDGVGNYSASVFFYEKQYEKTGRVEDLAVIVDISFGKDDDQTAKKYLTMLFEHKDFENYGKTTTQSGITIREYYQGLDRILNNNP